MFRQAVTKDIESITELLNGAKKRMRLDGLEQWADEDGYPNREIVESDISKGEMYVIELDNQIAAVCAINDDFYDSYPQKVDESLSRALHRIAVNENFLGQGVGKLIYKESEEEIKRMGYKTVIVDTYTQNVKMCSLIKAVGYEEVGEFPLFDDLPNWVMFKKELSGEK